jgi:hypothetical protein
MRLILCILAPLLAVAETKIDSGMLSGLEVRAVGPATMSEITDRRFQSLITSER